MMVGREATHGKTNNVRYETDCCIMMGKFSQVSTATADHFDRVIRTLDSALHDDKVYVFLNGS